MLAVMLVEIIALYRLQIDQITGGAIAGVVVLVDLGAALVGQCDRIGPARAVTDTEYREELFGATDRALEGYELTDEELDRIHEAACRMLSEQGMRIRNQEAIDVLVSAGATKMDDETVRIPRRLVEQSVASAPATFELYDRRGGSMVIGAEDHHHLPGGTMTEVLDYPGWQRRP